MRALPLKLDGKLPLKVIAEVNVTQLDLGHRRLVAVCVLLLSIEATFLVSLL